MEHATKNGRRGVEVAKTAKETEGARILEAIDGLHDLLDREMEQIRSGNIEGVIALTAEKNEIILVINGLQERIAERLERREAEDLRKKLRGLYERLAANQAGLEAMISALRDISSDLERLEERRQDNGLYGRRGRKMRNLSRETDSEIDGVI